MGEYLQFEYDYKPVEHERVAVPKISVIIPVYNVEKYLKQCLKSLEEQSLEDWEVICVDDGSTDNSLAILEYYANVDRRFVVLSQINSGQGVARNKALDMVRGEYILFADPDDLIVFNAFETLYNFAKPLGAEIIQFDFSDFNDVNLVVKNRYFAEKIKRKYGLTLSSGDYYNWEILKSACFKDLPKQVWTYFYSTSFVKNNDLKFAETKIAEDHVFSLAAIFSASKIYYLNEYLYKYRCRIGSAVEVVSNDNFCIFEIISKVRELLISKGLFDIFRDDFSKYSIDLMAIRYDCIPKESIDEYEKRCMQILSFCEYIIFKLRIKRIFTLLEWFFSVKNH